MENEGYHWKEIIISKDLYSGVYIKVNKIQVVEI